MSRQEIVLHLLSLLNRKIQLSANVIKFISFIKLLNLTALLTLYKKKHLVQTSRKKNKQKLSWVVFPVFQQLLFTGQIIFLFHHSRCCFFNIGDDRP